MICSTWPRTDYHLFRATVHSKIYGSFKRGRLTSSSYLRGQYDREEIIFETPFPGLINSSERGRRVLPGVRVCLAMVCDNTRACASTSGASEQHVLVWLVGQDLANSHLHHVARHFHHRQELGSRSSFFCSSLSAFIVRLVGSSRSWRGRCAGSTDQAPLTRTQDRSFSPGV